MATITTIAVAAFLLLPLLLLLWATESQQAASRMRAGATDAPSRRGHSYRAIGACEPRHAPMTTARRYCLP